MRRLNSIDTSLNSRTLLVVLTTTLLLFVSCGHTIQMLLFSPKAHTTEHAEKSSSNDKSQETDLTKVSALCEAVIPVYKFQIAFCCTFVRTFSFIEKTVTNESFSVLLPQSSYFRTVLRLIISPNAP